MNDDKYCSSTGKTIASAHQDRASDNFNPERTPPASGEASTTRRRPESPVATITARPTRSGRRASSAFTGKCVTSRHPTAVSMHHTITVQTFLWHVEMSQKSRAFRQLKRRNSRARSAYGGLGASLYVARALSGRSRKSLGIKSDFSCWDCGGCSGSPGSDSSEMTTAGRAPLPLPRL